MIPRKLSLVAACVVVAGCSRTPPAPRFGAVERVSASTDVGTAPMFAVSPSGVEAAAWVSAPDGGSDGRLYVSVNGAAPTELRDSLGSIEPHGEAPPKLAYSPDGALNALYVVAKTVPGRRFPASALRFVRSVDGRQWSAPVTVTDDSVFGSHNFHALFAARDGALYASWLDGRAGKSAVYMTHSTDGGRTWAPNVRVARGEACPCCRTTMASAPDGTMYVAWRQVFPGNERAVVVARSADHGATWQEPVRAQADRWVYDGCPHAGPSLQVDDAGRVHIAWWSGKQGGAGVWYANSTDGGRTFGTPTPLGVAEFSRPAHVQLALGGGGRLVAAWEDGTLQVPRVMVRVSNDGGARWSDAEAVSDSGRAAAFPVVAAANDRVTVAWSEESAAAAAAEGAAHARMKDPKATMPLGTVGSAQVMVRRATLQQDVSAQRGAAYRPLMAGDRAPAYVALTLSGDSVRVGAGKPMLLNVWATWCTSCKEEMADLATLERKYAPSGVRVVAVSVDDGDGTRVRRFAESENLPFTVAHDPAGVVQKTFQAVGVPETYLVSGDGRLLWVRRGGLHEAPAEVLAGLDSAVRVLR